MKKLLLIAAASLAALRVACADTSYLLIQGPFGSAGAVETFEWQVLHPAGSLNTGLDLLSAVFGPPKDTGTQYTDDFGSHELFSAGNNLQGASYIDFGGGSFFPISYTLDGTKVEQNTSYDPGWVYYVAGGSGTSGNYASGAWTFSNDGVVTRVVANGSFDGWVFGETNPPAATIMDGTGNNAPTVANFEAAIMVVPEPGGAVLLVFGVVILLWRRR